MFFLRHLEVLYNDMTYRFKFCILKLLKYVKNYVPVVSAKVVKDNWDLVSHCANDVALVVRCSKGTVQLNNCSD